MFKMFSFAWLIASAKGPASGAIECVVAAQKAISSHAVPTARADAPILVVE
jgi:hypothetical protein